MRQRLVGRAVTGPATCPGRRGSPPGCRRGSGRSASPAPAARTRCSRCPPRPARRAGTAIAVLDPAVEHRVRRLVDQQRHAHLAQQPGGLAGPLGAVRRDAGVRRPARTAPRSRARPSSPRAASRGRTGGCRRCRRGRAPSGPGSGRARRGGTCASPTRRTAPATCRSPPWSRSPARRGTAGSPGRRSRRSSSPPRRTAARSCWPGRSGSPRGRRPAAGSPAGSRSACRRRSCATARARPPAASARTGRSGGRRGDS